MITRNLKRSLLFVLATSAAVVAVTSLSGAQQTEPATPPADIKSFLSRYASLHDGGAGPVTEADLASARGFTGIADLPAENVRLAYASEALRAVVAVPDRRRLCLSFRDALGLGGGSCYSAEAENQETPALLIQSVPDGVYRAVALVPDGLTALHVEREGGEATSIDVSGNFGSALIRSRPVAYGWTDARGDKHRVEVTAP